MNEKKLVKFENMMSYVLMVLLVSALMLVFTSCGSTYYNVGTGKPMTKQCQGAWSGGQ